MRVSVVIPVYNEEKYIARCLFSLLRQEVYPNEIIIVDNNSTDETVSICKKFPVRIVRARKQGIIQARNKGFDEAQYDLIARCDADTIVPPDWIKKIKHNFKMRRIDALMGPWIYNDLPFKTTLYAKSYIYVLKKVKKQPIFIGANMIIRKTTWQQVKQNVCLNEKRVHEDTDLAIHIQQAGGKIHYDKSLVVEVSGRRIKRNPLSYFVEYSVRNLRTLHTH